MPSIAVIGAGVAGLTAATHLKDSAEVTVFEKSRGVGGRVTTRRAPPFHFDHGAQFFIAKSPDFQQFIEPMLNAKIIKPWNAKFKELDPSGTISSRQWTDEYPHYVGTPGMNAIAKHLAKPLNIHLNTLVTSCKKNGQQWQLFDAQNTNLGSFDWVISCVPPQQAIEVIPKEAIFYEQLCSIKMTGCFSLMLGFNEPIFIDFDAALISNADISWISVNSSKPDRPLAQSVLVHSTNTWADANMSEPEASVIRHLSTCISEIIGVDVTKAAHIALHRWRYANIAKHQTSLPQVDEFNNIAICGDWLKHGRIEAAFESALLTAKKLSPLLKR